MVISRTPFRISFFGGGTDFPHWYKKHGGAVLATSIDKYCYLTVRYLPPFWGDKYRIVYSKVENCKNLSQIEHPAVGKIIKFLKIKEGLEIHHDGDLPARSGIASSSAFTVGLLNALHALNGRIINKKDLAAESIYIEQKILKETVGCQDQIMVAHGGFKHVEFQENGEITVSPVTISKKRFEELNSSLMLFYTGMSRTSSDVQKKLVGNMNKQEDQLKVMKLLVDKAIALLDSQRDINDFGRLLDESWRIKKSLTNAISNIDIDDMYQNALNKGALGGKIIGAGGGGFLLLFVPPKFQKLVLKKFNKLIHVPFKFESSGSQIIFYDDQEDYEESRKIIKLGFNSSSI